jgi:hypothetical protein
MNPNKGIRTEGSNPAQSTNYTGSYIAINNVQSSFGGIQKMPVRLSTTVSKISSLLDSTNAALITEFYQCTKKTMVHASESHTNNTLKPIWDLLYFLDQMLHFMMSKEVMSLLHF